MSWTQGPTRLPLVAKRMVATGAAALVAWLPGVVRAAPPSGAAVLVPTRRYPIGYGFVYRTPLADLSGTAPLPAQSAAYSALCRRDLDQAAPVLRQQVARRPEDLAAYVALLQADPGFLGQEKRRLTAPAGRGSGGPASPAAARLGAVLFYDWAAGAPGQPDGERRLPRAVRALSGAWESTKDPVAGLLLLEASTPARAAGVRPEEVLDALVRDLASARAYREYRRFLAAPGTGAAAAVPRGVPASKRTALCGVLKSLWSLNGSKVTYGTVVNGRFVPQRYVPPSARQRALRRYFEAWIKDLTP